MSTIFIDIVFLAFTPLLFYPFVQTIKPSSLLYILHIFNMHLYQTHTKYYKTNICDHYVIICQPYDLKLSTVIEQEKSYLQNLLVGGAIKTRFS